MALAHLVDTMVLQTSRRADGCGLFRADVTAAVAHLARDRWIAAVGHVAGADDLKIELMVTRTAALPEPVRLTLASVAWRSSP